MVRYGIQSDPMISSHLKSFERIFIDMVFYFRGYILTNNPAQTNDDFFAGYSAFFKMKIKFLDTRKKCLILGLTIVISFCHIGSSLLSGLLFVACMARYETGRKQASLPFAICNVVRNISSPFVGYLGKRLGPATVTGIGCLLATIGIGACYFAEDIVTVTFLWGIIYGLGVGMGIGLLPQILNQHFQEHVDKANGLTFGGGSIGSFILPILVDKLIVEYGTSGMFLILSGIILNSVPAALLLRKLGDPSLKSMKNADGLLHETICENHEISKCTKKDDLHERKTFTNREMNAKTFECQNRMPCEIFQLSELENKGSYTDIQQEDSEIECTYNEELICLKSRNAFSNDSKKESEVQVIDNKTATEDKDTNLPVTPLNVQSKSLKENFEYSYKNLYSKSSQCIPSSNLPNTDSASSNSFLVFLDVSYILILLAQGFLQIVITTLWTVIVDASEEKGVAESDGVYIIFCIGVSSTFGLFCLGYITDGGYMTKINFQILCAAGLGAFHIVFIFLEGFVMVMISGGFLGLFIAGNLMIGVGIIHQCVEKEFMTMAIASRWFGFALMSFAQAPMIGFFRENLKSYDGLFILLAGLSAICIVLTWYTPIAVKRRDKRKSCCNRS
ncbi:uncharacterized protein TNIN_319651 [Trichonephila inaurata madagascariensis]|uniref:Uncharacterized protein n=1 Tax=Trichonephila inaurata madagascariensis TaxID=2747483 RepID=A0A8X6XQD3_9ARAC|nr:uncharacterized protein TNIN_319651 [Trichonephila inaurata madagascariensis]